MKSKENTFLFFFIAFVYKITISSNFYAPHHGHSEVDGHFGQAKIALRRSAGQGPLYSENQIYEAVESLPNTTAEKLAFEKVNYKVFLLKKQIRKFFEWEFDGIQATCRSRELTGRIAKLKKYIRGMGG